jgi:hypothetical protein
VLGVALVTTQIVRGGAGLAQILECLVAPAAVTLLLAACRAHETNKVVVLVRALAVFQAVLAVAQALSGTTLLYTRSYASTEAYRFELASGFRSVGTLDHPLTLGLFLLIGIVALASVRAAAPRFAAQGVCIVAIFGTGSRTALVLSVVLIATVSLSGNLIRRATYRALLGVAGVIALFLSGLGSGVLSRFQNDAGSSVVRAQATGRFFDVLPNYIISGDGVGSSFDQSRRFARGASFENPLFMYTVDVGVIAALLLFSAYASIFVLAPRRSPWRLGGLIVMLMILSYSSLGAKSSAALFFAIPVGCAMALRSQHVLDEGGYSEAGTPLQAEPPQRLSSRAF